MPTLWADQVFSESVGAGSPGALDRSFLGLNTLNALERRIQKFTLLRTIIGIDIMPTVRDPGEGDNLLSIGIGIVSDGVSQADSPDPADESSFPIMPWVWRARYRVYAVAVDDQNVNRVRVDLDIRAQRKLDNGRPALMTRILDFQGTPFAITITGAIRMLYLVR